MHILVLAMKIALQAAFAAFVPGGGVIVALNLYRKYRARKAAKLAANASQPQPTPAPAPVD